MNNFKKILILPIVLIISLVSFSIPGTVHASKGSCVIANLDTYDTTDAGTRYYEDISKSWCLELGGCYSGRNFWGTFFTECSIDGEIGPKVFYYGL
jgi:hypothetical protein